MPAPELPAATARPAAPGPLPGNSARKGGKEKGMPRKMMVLPHKLYSYI